MTRQSERLEREAEAIRTELAYSLDELRARMTPGQIADEVVRYARATPVAEFGRNLMRDIRDYPLPIVVIFAGVAWAVIASLARRRPAAAIEPLPREKAPVAVSEGWEVAPVGEPIV